MTRYKSLFFHLLVHQYPSISCLPAMKLQASPLSSFAISALLTLTTANAVPTNATSGFQSPGYGTLKYNTTGSIIRAVIDNPPINLWDCKLSHDFSSFLVNLAAQAENQNSNNNSTSIKVITISSANPEYWIAHIDIHYLSATNPIQSPGNATTLGEQLIRSRSLLATLPVIFIAEIDGRVTGVGDGIALQCDIRYAGPHARLSRLEIGFGEFPGAGGLQFLTTLIGRARALEYMLSARAVDAATAAAIGWVNWAFGSGQELKSEVDALAERIARFPAQGLAAMKARVNVQKPSEADLEGDRDLFVRLAGTEVVQVAADRFLELSGEQRDGAFEREVPDDVVLVEG